MYIYAKFFNWRKILSEFAQKVSSLQSMLGSNLSFLFSEKELVMGTNGLAGEKVSVQSIMLQFSFSNFKVVPKGIRELPPESFGEAREREQRTNGERVIDPVDNVDLSGFVEELDENGYELVNAVSQERVNLRRPRQVYYMVRFVFVPMEHERNNRNDMSAALLQLCEEAMWKVKVFVNPFFSKDNKVADEHIVSINMAGREPLYDDFGTPRKIWEKDKDGKCVGDEPILLRPDNKLVYSDDRIDVFPIHYSEVSR